MSATAKHNKLPELLAPAGDFTALRAALAAGADAIYVGGKHFSARQNAINFKAAELQAATELVHLQGKKIYVTANTLVADTELARAVDYVAELYNYGVDAVIVQDLGLIRLLRKYLPDFPIHASTQMTVHNLEGLLFLKSLGIKRVVLARELPEREVALLAAATEMELEVFSHGALCISYSGQCLMSSMIGGRSGNRGHCAQPCRMEYQLVNEKGQVLTPPGGGNHLLSPKDQALAALLPNLCRAGVASLKIEGRMKRPEYVYTVVGIYRRLLDRYAQNPAGYHTQEEDLQDLAQAFNRGFSSGFFGGNQNSRIMGFNRPNNRGVYLGRISRVDQQLGEVTLKLAGELTLGDEIEVWVSDGGRVATGVKKLFQKKQEVNTAGPGEEVSFPCPGKIKVKDRVYKVFSQKLQQEVADQTDSRSLDLKVPCFAKVTGQLNDSLKLVLTDDRGNKGMGESQVPLQAAQKRPLTKEVLEEQLGRMGNTAYKLIKIESQLEESLMLPLSELNFVRRIALEQLNEARLAVYRRKLVELSGLVCLEKESGANKEVENHSGKVIKNQISVWVGDVAGLAAALKAGGDLFYIGGEELTGFRWTEAALKEALALVRAKNKKLVYALPRINRISEAEWLKGSYDAATNLPFDGIMISELGSYHKMLHDSLQPLYINYPLNLFNHQAIFSLDQARVQQAALSPELALKQMGKLRKKIKHLPLEILVQGPLELMLTEYCPLKTILGNESQACPKHCRQQGYALRDRLRMDFPIYMDQFCRMHLLNCVDHCLYGELGQLFEVGKLTWRLDLRIFSSREVGVFVAAYHRALQVLTEGRKLVDVDQTIERFKKITRRGITKGHYYRGVE